MLIIDFTSSRKKAFRHGFVKGMAAPLMVFGSFSAPALPQIEPVRVPNTSPRESMRHDWEMVGRDLRKAMLDYGEIQSKK